MTAQPLRGIQVAADLRMDRWEGTTCVQTLMVSSQGGGADHTGFLWNASPRFLETTTWNEDASFRALKGHRAGIACNKRGKVACLRSKRARRQLYDFDSLVGSVETIPFGELDTVRTI